MGRRRRSRWRNAWGSALALEVVDLEEGLEPSESQLWRDLALQSGELRRQVFHLQASPQVSVADVEVLPLHLRQRTLQPSLELSPVGFCVSVQLARCLLVASVLPGLETGSG